MKRFERNIPLEGFGIEGQKKLLASSAVVIGAGGLGSSVIYYLAAAGVGKIRVIDSDEVEESNLNRQIIHSAKNIGKTKVVSVKERLAEFSPLCKVDALQERISENNIADIISEADIVLDCTDNFQSRFVIADACWREKKLLVYASAQGYGGQLLVQNPVADKPCYRCLIAVIPEQGDIPLPAETGVLGGVVGVMGSLQATEAIKALIGAGKICDEEMISFDALRSRLISIKREKRLGCSLCGD